MTTSRVERRPRPIPFGADQSDLATGRPAYDDGDWLVLRPLVPAEEIALHAQRIEPASPDRAADVVTALDLKLTGRGDVWHVANRHAVSASFLRALSAFSTDTVAWTEVDHATPLDVHRSRLFWIVPEPGQATLATGSATPLLPSGEAGRIPGSYAGLPGRPLSVDVTDAESVPLSFTRWFRGSSAYPQRLLIVRGALLRRFEALNGRSCECVWEKIDASGHVPCPTAAPEARLQLREDGHAVTWTLGESLAFIERTATSHGHWLPASPPRTELAAALDELTSIRGRPLPDGLVHVLTRHDGMALFRGAIGFLRCSRGARDATSTDAGFSVPDTILEAQRRVCPSDWQLTLPENAILFGWRIGDFPSFWTLTAEDEVVLATQAGELLGPRKTFEVWLTDQLRDLDYAAQHPSPRTRAWFSG